MMFHLSPRRDRNLRRSIVALLGVIFLGVAQTGASRVGEAADFVLGLQAYDQGNYQKAFTEWLPLALGGNPDAQFNIGFMYQNGLGVDANPLEAEVWYGRAARAGVPDAQYNLGILYSDGRSIARDLDQAARWFFEAALRGHADAQFNIGLMLSVGAGVAPDMVEAYKWVGLARQQFTDETRSRLASNTIKRFETIMDQEEILSARLRVSEFEPGQASVILTLPDN